MKANINIFEIIEKIAEKSREYLKFELLAKKINTKRKIKDIISFIVMLIRLLVMVYVAKKDDKKITRNNENAMEKIITLIKENLSFKIKKKILEII